MTTATLGLTEAARPAQRYGWIIFLIALVQLITTTDFAIVSVALPSIGRGLHVPGESLSWVVAANALTFAGMLILAGRAADLLGQRRCLIAGLALFGLGSLLSGLAFDIRMLIVTRALQGLGAAILSPANFSLMATLIPEGPVRRKALGVFGIMQGMSLLIGLSLGGIITSVAGWRADFLINLPIVLVAIALAAQIVPPRAPRVPGAGRTRIDYAGAILITGGVGLLLYALSSVARLGLTSLAVSGSLAGGALAFLVFFWHEGRAADPLVPPTLYRYRDVVGANAATLWLTAAGGGGLVLVSLYMQQALGFTPVRAGLGLLPYAAASMTVSRLMAFTIGRFSVRLNVLAGGLVFLAGAFYLAAVAGAVAGAGAGWAGILPGMLMVATGSTLGIIALMPLGTAAVPHDRQGVASALLLTMQQVGISFGASTALGLIGTSGGFRAGFEGLAGLSVAALACLLAFTRK